MDNKRIINIIAGSLALALLYNDLFLIPVYSLFDAGTIIGFTLGKIMNLTSFIGIILTIIFSIILIKNNLLNKQ